MAKFDTNFDMINLCSDLRVCTLVATVVYFESEVALVDNEICMIIRKRNENEDFLADVNESRMNERRE